MSKLFYEEHPDKMITLIKEQLKDEWTKVEIEQYFGHLGYDYFFIRGILSQATKQ